MGIYYGDKREAKVKICHALKGKDWKIYGYKKDKSDSMTDYYDPAYWDGIATKNGFTLVVDTYGNENSGKEITKYTMELSNKNINTKIEKLKALRDDQAATTGEKENAQNMIYKLQANEKYEQEKREATKQIIDTYPIYKASGDISKNTKWHIEKDGAILAKGTGIYKYCSLPYEYNCFEMKYKSNTYRDCTEPSKPNLEQQKLIDQFENFINKLEIIINKKPVMSDGTKTGEQEGLKQQMQDKLKKVTITETKKVLKPVQVADRTDIREGDLLSMSYHGHYWRVVHIYNNNKNIKCITYELVGSASRGYQKLKNSKRYYQTDIKLQKEIGEGKTKIYELKEIEESKEIEKWVKIKDIKKNVNKQYNSDVTEPTEKQAQEQTNNNKYNIIKDIDTRDNSNLWVVKIKNKLDKEEYKKVNSKMRELQGYYSKFKHGFIFKYDPSDVLNNDINNIEGTTITETKEQQSKKDNTKLLEKINKNIETLEKKIDNLNGDYKTNTYKRIREQAGRQSKIESWEIDVKILEHVKEKLINNTLTILEKGLIINTFRDKIHQYYIRKYSKYPIIIEFPYIKNELPKDNWYNLEVPKEQNRLKKQGINNTLELNNVIDEYKIIYKKCIKFESTTEKQIKKLTMEYKMQQKGDINFTPKNIVDKMIELANIDNNSIVLEPSAGIGNIADEIKKITNNVDCIEYMNHFKELLKLKGHNIVANDFLQYNKYNYYDAIIMNPPFSHNQDIEHLQHAYKMLKNGGILVCITSPHWSFSKDSKSKNFKEWINSKVYETIDLNMGTFEMTNVNSKIVILNKEEETFEQVI